MMRANHGQLANRFPRREVRRSVEPVRCWIEPDRPTAPQWLNRVRVLLEVGPTVLRLRTSSPGRFAQKMAG
jgi:hypothetical protein